MGIQILLDTPKVQVKSIGTHLLFNFLGCKILCKEKTMKEEEGVGLTPGKFKGIPALLSLFPDLKKIRYNFLIVFGFFDVHLEFDILCA